MNYEFCCCQNKMGRKKQNKVYMYFNVLKENNKSTCNLCKKILNSIHGANLLKHLKHIHKNEYDKIVELNSESSSRNVSLSDISDIIRTECLNLVTIHGRPLAMLDDQAFQNILENIPDLNTTINSKNIRQRIHDTAASLRSDISNQLMNKMISVKVDIASLSTRSFMGVNAQYANNGQIVLKNLAMVELLQRHTAVHLKEQILFVLQRFRIGLENIYSFTTDNGANMLKMSQLISEENSNVTNLVRPSTSNAVEENLNESSADENDASINENLENYLDSESKSYFDEYIEFDDDTIENGFTETVTSALSLELNTEDEDHRKIGIVRCAAHTLQLAILSALQEARIKEVISGARNVVKRLLTQSYLIKIKEKKLKMPILDCVTRWNSTVEMVERLIDLKPICGNNDLQTHLSDAVWDTLKDFLNSLLPAKNLIIFLQSEQITLGDFYLQWLLCKINLNNIKSNLSQLVLKYMTEREQVLFSNDCFINAIFIDPRVNSILTKIQQEKAKTNLILLHDHLKKLAAKHKKTSDPEVQTEITREFTEAAGPSKKALLQLEDFLNHQYLEKHDDLSVLLVRDQNSLYSKKNIIDEIEDFQKEPLLHSSYNIFSYWNNKKDKFPYLHELSQVVLAAPASQVSVERLFSSLKFVVSKYRYNLKSDLIENILLIRNNALYNKDK